MVLKKHIVGWASSVEYRSKYRRIQQSRCQRKPTVTWSKPRVCESKSCAYVSERREYERQCRKRELLSVMQHVGVPGEVYSFLD
jgi:hypothetical protein